MPFLLRNLALTLDADEALLESRLAARVMIPQSDIRSFEIVRKGIDARRKRHITFVYTVRFSVVDEKALQLRCQDDSDLVFLPSEKPAVFPRIVSDHRIVVVGTGPAGLFAALRLADYGLTATLIERGKPVHERVRDVQLFWGRGELDPESNVQFGEGGAGTFSDGKLTTRVRDENCSYVLERMAEFGAPPEVRYLAKPHIGTDRLRSVVSNIRQHLEQLGFTVMFRSMMSDVVTIGGRIAMLVVNGATEIPCDSLILAPGHSSRDTYRMLHERGVLLESRPFAVGVRVEHPQELINRIQYGIPSHPRLPAADYALAFNDSVSGRSAYSFCMCPGGVVVASASEPGGVVTNGMSNHLRNSPYANSALVVTVGRNDFDDASPLAGVEFQRKLERDFFIAGGGGYRAPAQNMLSFLQKRDYLPVSSSYRPGVTDADLSGLFPPYVTRTLRDGICHFDRKMRGFITADASLVGVETRTSAPLRILRGADLQSVSLEGLYPAGEGAGYAGGIMSAALDGIRVADAIAMRLHR
jgi:uncharacterized FAD-dependent dehydrogenase